MIVDQAIYREGHRLVCQDLSEELDRLREEGNGFLWIGLKDPTDAEFALVNQELELHPLAVEDAVRGDQRAKIEHYEGSLLVVLKTLRYVEDTSDVETGEVMVFLGDRFVVTVRRGDANPLAGVRARLEQNAEHLSLGPAAVLHAVMDSVVDNYILVDNEIHEDLEHIEQLVFSGTRGVDATAIYRLKREVLEIRRASQPLADAMERLFVQPHRAIVDRDGSDVLAFFRDVKDHLLKVNDHVESYDRLLSDILSAHLAQISVGQNDDMRKISRRRLRDLRPPRRKRLTTLASAPLEEAIELVTGGYRYAPEVEAEQVQLIPHLQPAPPLVLAQHRRSRLIVYRERADGDLAERVASLGRALADPKRVEILRLLAHGVDRASRLVAETGLTRSTVHHHLSQLREARLIDLEGNARAYRYLPREDALPGDLGPTVRAA